MMMMYEFIERDRLACSDEDYENYEDNKTYFIKSFENNELYEFVDYINTKTGVYGSQLHVHKDGVEYIYDADELVKVRLNIKDIFNKRRINSLTIDKEIHNIKNKIKPYKFIDGKYMFMTPILDYLIEAPIITNSRMKRCE